MLGLYWENGNEHGNYYMIIGYTDIAVIAGNEGIEA